MEIRLLPLEKLQYFYVNANRDPGNQKEGRAPAPHIDLSQFRTLHRHRGDKEETLGPKPGGDHNLWGAASNITDWKAWTDRKQRKRKRK